MATIREPAHPLHRKAPDEKHEGDHHGRTVGGIVAMVVLFIALLALMIWIAVVAPAPTENQLDYWIVM